MGFPITNNGPWGAKSGKLFFFKNAMTLIASLFASAMASTHFDTYPLPHEYISSHDNSQTAPYNQCPIHQTTQSLEWDLKGSLASSKFLDFFGTYHITWRTHENLGEWLANSTHIARSYGQSEYHYDSHPQARNGMPTKRLASKLPERNGE